MTQYAEITGDTLVIERLLPGAPERVWAHFVDPEKRMLWLAGGSTEEKPGGKLVFEFDHRRLSDQPPPEKYADQQVVSMEARIIEFDPPRRISFNWPEPSAPDAQVTVTLTAEGERTRLKLVHEKLGDADYRIGVSAGWHGHLDILEDVLEDRPRPDFWARHMPLEEEYKQRLGL